MGPAVAMSLGACTAAASSSELTGCRTATGAMSKSLGGPSDLAAERPCDIEAAADGHARDPSSPNIPMVLTWASKAFRGSL